MKKIAKIFMLVAILTGALSAIKPFIIESKASEKAPRSCVGSGAKCTNFLEDIKEKSMY